MTERVHAEQVRARTEDTVEETVKTSRAIDYSAVLDEIDAVLEADAEEYVRSFVQKGGQ
ncbi:MAG TPA: ubiquitin-like protein Pup [Propionicimonas sp.]|nr:ubiquitin-like protein Pup [Propionicimonas sp.]HQA77043.1 ubiquitin-like protein Pup [Propionicimonas sp.]HQD96173.1 ubiquitin-like protein Pup [Propionicimonas sp.]